MAALCVMILQEFDPQFPYELTQQHQIEGAGIDYTPCSRRKFTARVPTNYVFESCSEFGAGMWRVTCDWGQAGQPHEELDFSIRPGDLAAVSIVLVQPRGAAACERLASPNPACHAFFQSSAVFVGEVEALLPGTRTLSLGGIRSNELPEARVFGSSAETPADGSCTFSAAAGFPYQLRADLSVWDGTSRRLQSTDIVTLGDDVPRSVDLVIRR